MFIAPAEYLKRITYTLEHVVAPQVESDFLRGQVLAAVFLIDQLLDRVDYKPRLIEQEIDADMDTLKKILEALEGRGGEVPEEIGAFMEEAAGDGKKAGVAFRDKCDGAFSAAIDYFYANRGKLDPARALEIEGLIINQFVKIGGRNLGMLKLSTSSKLIQTKD